MPRHKSDPSKPSQATVEGLMMAVISDKDGGKEFLTYRKSRHITLGVLERTLTLMQKGKIKPPGYFLALKNELEATGSTRRSSPKIGDTKVYSVVNYNNQKKIPVNPTCNIPLALYEGMAYADAKIEVTFGPKGPSIKLIPGNKDKLWTDVVQEPKDESSEDEGSSETEDASDDDDHNDGSSESSELNKAAE